MRTTRLTDHGVTHFQRLPDVFALTRAGADLLSSQLNIELKNLSVVEYRRRSLHNLEHTVAIGQFYAALRAELEHDKLPFSNWRGDNLLHLSYDNVDAVGSKEKTSVIPDATCTIDDQRMFIEIDRGTTALKKWRLKAYAFEAYRGSTKLRARYGVDDFMVLVVAPTMARIKRIAAEIATATGTASPDYLFILESKVHPQTIRENWHAIANATLRTKWVITKTIETADIELAPYHLWEKADEF